MRHPHSSPVLIMHVTHPCPACNDYSVYCRTIRRHVQRSTCAFSVYNGLLSRCISTLTVQSAVTCNFTCSAVVMLAESSAWRRGKQEPFDGRVLCNACQTYTRNNPGCFLRDNDKVSTPPVGLPSTHRLCLSWAIHTQLSMPLFDLVEIPGQHPQTFLQPVRVCFWMM